MNAHRTAINALNGLDGGTASAGMPTTRIGLDDVIIDADCQRSSKAIEKIISQDGYSSYMYARRIGRRFLKGEPAIAKKVAYAINYAEEILKDRFLLAEPNILKSNPTTIFGYYKRFKHKFPNNIWQEGEQALEKKLSTLFKYTIEIKKEKSKLLEQKILSEPDNKKSPKYIFEYCCRVLKNRWKEAEHIVFKDPEYRIKYVTRFNFMLPEENHNQTICELAFGTEEEKYKIKKYFNKLDDKRKIAKQLVEDLIDDQKISAESKVQDLLNILNKK